jgi:DNA-binding MarR family transcriptional regulator
MVPTHPHLPVRTDRDGGDGLGIVDALAQLSFLIQGVLVDRAAAHDLSTAQTRLLGILRDRRPTMQELARLQGLDKSSVTGLVDRAEARGLVRREPSTDDRRTVRVVLTPVGRRLIGEVAGAFERDIDAATADLTAEEVTQLADLATRIVRRAATTAPGDGATPV